MDLGRDLAVIVWHECDHRIELTYLDGEADELFATDGVAARLAANAGLVSLPGADHTRRWVRHMKRRGWR